MQTRGELHARWTFAGGAGGDTQFKNLSTAGSGTFNTDGGTVNGAFGGAVKFFNSSSALNGTFNANGGTTTGAAGASITFYDGSAAANATLIANAGVNGGSPEIISFQNASVGGSARVEAFGPALSISAFITPAACLSGPSKGAEKSSSGRTI